MTNRLSPVIESNDDNKEPLPSVALVQVLLALLWRQHETRESGSHEIQTFGLTCRERSVLGVLADGLIAIDLDLRTTCDHIQWPGDPGSRPQSAHLAKLATR